MFKLQVALSPNVLWNVLQMYSRLMWLMKAEIYLVREGSLVCGRSLPPSSSTRGGWSWLALSSPFLRRINSVYPVTFNFWCCVLYKPPNYNYIKTEGKKPQRAVWTRHVQLVSNVIWSVAIWNFTFDAVWEKVEQSKGTRKKSWRQA